MSLTVNKSLFPDMTFVCLVLKYSDTHELYDVKLRPRVEFDTLSYNNTSGGRRPFTVAEAASSVP